VFEGVSGGQYSCYSVATDGAGNREVGTPVIRTTTVHADPADYNGNGSVEWGDYQAWQATYGQTGQSLDADGNQDGVVNAADYVMWRKKPVSYGGDPNGYVTWRAHLGQTAGSGSSGSAALPLSTAIPEPTSEFLFLSFAAVAVWRRRR
jgi:hypothetical protein